jgi:hypothetical protein
MKRKSHIEVPAHKRAFPKARMAPAGPPPGPPPGPQIGPNEFDAGQEKAMRQGVRASRMATPPAPSDNDADDIGGGMGGM